jgi:hypothetical protein
VTRVPPPRGGIRLRSRPVTRPTGAPGPRRLQGEALVVRGAQRLCPNGIAFGLIEELLLEPGPSWCRGGGSVSGVGPLRIGTDPARQRSFTVDDRWHRNLSRFRDAIPQSLAPDERRRRSPGALARTPQVIAQRSQVRAWDTLSAPAPRRSARCKACWRRRQNATSPQNGLSTRMLGSRPPCRFRTKRMRRPR